MRTLELIARVPPAELSFLDSIQKVRCFEGSVDEGGIYGDGGESSPPRATIDRHFARTSNRSFELKKKKKKKVCPMRNVLPLPSPLAISSTRVSLSFSRDSRTARTSAVLYGRVTTRPSSTYAGIYLSQLSLADYIGCLARGRAGWTREIANKIEGAPCSF